MIMTRIPIVLSCIVASALTLPIFVFAQNTGAPGFVPLADASQSPMLQSVYSSGNLAEYINRLFVIAISVGAILAVLRIAYAGYMYMMSDMWTSKSRAREILGEVVLGLVLLLGIYLILYQINPELLDLSVLQNVEKITP